MVIFLRLFFLFVNSLARVIWSIRVRLICVLIGNLNHLILCDLYFFLRGVSTSLRLGRILFRSCFCVLIVMRLVVPSRVTIIKVMWGHKTGPTWFSCKAPIRKLFCYSWGTCPIIIDSQSGILWFHLLVVGLVNFEMFAERCRVWH